MLPRILIASDAHNEGRRDRIILPDTTDVDVCIVAGDFNEPIAKSIYSLQEASKGEVDIIYVAGNHEHYGRVYRDNIIAGYRAADECPNVHFLENEIATVKGIRFIGATLWTDYAINGNVGLGKMAAQQSVHDYRYIYERESVLVTADFFEAAHSRSRQFISSALAVPFDGPTVVVTHHAPHPDSIFHWYRNDAHNAAYASDLTEIIFNGAPALWVHGHTHHSFDYKVFQTRIICNPLGTAGAPNPEYNPRLVINGSDLITKEQAPMSYEELFGSTSDL